MFQLRRISVITAIAIGSVLGAQVAQASEVVKLARLVVTGKRSSNETPRAAVPEVRTPAESPSHATASAADESPAGTPAPPRGSFIGANPQGT